MPAPRSTTPLKELFSDTIRLTLAQARSFLLLIGPVLFLVVLALSQDAKGLGAQLIRFYVPLAMPILSAPLIVLTWTRLSCERITELDTLRAVRARFPSLVGYTILSWALFGAIAITAAASGAFVFISLIALLLGSLVDVPNFLVAGLGLPFETTATAGGIWLVLVLGFAALNVASMTALIRVALAIQVIVIEGAGPLVAIGRSWRLMKGWQATLRCMALSMFAMCAIFPALLFNIVPGALGGALAYAAMVFVGLSVQSVAFTLLYDDRVQALKES